MTIEYVVTLIVGSLGLVMSIIALVTIFIIRQNAQQIALRDIASELEFFIKNRLEEIRTSGQYLRPDLSIFLTAQWKFIEKVYRYRFEKSIIAKKIVLLQLKDNDKTLLDSGSTTDLVTAELLDSKLLNFQVYSNNVFAAMHLVGDSRVRLHLLPGLFNERFAAVYSQKANIGMDEYGINTFILAAAAFNFTNGPLVEKADTENREFKHSALKLFEKDSTTKLIFAVDASKFLPADQNYIGVQDSKEWIHLREAHAKRIFIITNQPPQSFTEEENNIYKNEIKAFRDIGIEVHNASLK